MLIVAVTGWRRHSDSGFIRAEMNALVRLLEGEQMHVRVGDAEGADAIVEEWCMLNGIGYDRYEARRYPSGALMPGAGPERNRKMLTMQYMADQDIWYPRLADMLVGFPEPGVRPKIPGSGSWGCIGEAFALGIPVKIPGYKLMKGELWWLKSRMR